MNTTVVVDDPAEPADTKDPKVEDMVIRSKHVRMPRGKTTDNNPRRTDKFTRRVLRNRARSL